jgi:uncharacterized protein YjbI with pentapeptide repeats
LVLALLLIAVLPDGMDGFITEAVGIMFTILIIDFYRKEESQREYEHKENLAQEESRRSLVRQARSRNNNSALDAIDIMREEGWLDKTKDGLCLLRGEKLNHADLKSADLTNAELEETEFRSADLEAAVFSHCNLTAARFDEADLIKTNFSRARLTGAFFVRARLTGCEFKDSKNPGATQHHDNLERLNFEGASLQSIDFSNLVMRFSVFQKAELKEVNFTGCWLEDSNFRDVRLSEKSVVFNSAYLDRVDFGKTGQIKGISFKGAHLNEVDFHQVLNVSEVDFSSAQLQYAKCKGISFRDSNFDDATLNGMVAVDAVFSNVTFNGNTTFFDGIKLEQHWVNILENQRVVRHEIDLEEACRGLLAVLENIVKGYGLRSINATITLPEYELRDDDTQGQDIGADMVRLHRLSNTLDITLSYVDHIFSKPASSAVYMPPPEDG